MTRALLARARAAGLVTMISGAAAVACGEPEALQPIGQLVVYVDTDALLPPPPGVTRTPDDPAPLFDRLRFEVFRPGETSPCAGCTNEFDVDRAVVNDGRASIGITTRPGASGHAVRVRLFKASFVEKGQPRADATIDVTASLPAVPDEGIVRVTVFLPTDAVAHPIGSRAAPVEPTPGPPQGRAGTWAGARRIGCAAAPADDEVCVPGGAFWMGNLRMATLHAAVDDAPMLRLVVLSPFYLQKQEVLVPTFRAARIATASDPLPSGTTALGELPPGVECTYTGTPGNSDYYPVNCISHDKAEQFCQLRGGDLPTQAQHEYVASGLEGRLYPWGDDPATCNDAVFARVRDVTGPDFSCAGGGIAPPGSGGRDRVTIGGGVVVDLAGNLQEHVLDRWNGQQEACWRPGVLRDPLCDVQSTVPELTGRHVVVSGAFLHPGGYLAAPFRFVDPPLPPKKNTFEAFRVTAVGFRCARAASPAPR